MKKLLYSIAKAAARWVLGYAGTAAAAVLDSTNARLQDKAYARAVASWAHESAELLAAFAAALEDAAISEAERARVSDSAQLLADRLKLFMD